MDKQKLLKIWLGEPMELEETIAKLKNRSKPTYPEFDEQVKVIGFFNLLKRGKQIPNHYLLYSNRNTQKLTKPQQSRENRAGMIAGIPDLFLAVPAKEFHGLYIEMKAPKHKPKTARSKGGLSEIQEEIITKLRENRYAVVVCYTADEAINQLKAYLGLKL